MDSNLIHDWNPPAEIKLALLNDETLRDGLQSPSVRDPSIAEKIEILHLMNSLGINALDLGLPGAGPRAVEHVEALAREIVANKLNIRANCAARTHENDIRPIADIVQRTGLAIECATFIGSSPIRRYTEGWTDDFLLETTEKAIKFVVSLGLDAMYVTEDTTRCDPATIKRLYSTAISCGAHSIVICDTAGHSTPAGAFALTKFVLDEIVKPSGEKIRVDWHGHNDRGLSVANSFAALAAGADCVHACALSSGERVGNTPMDQMLVNLKLMDVSRWNQQDLTSLKSYCESVSRATGVPIPSKLSRSRRRRLPHRNGRPRLRSHQSPEEKRLSPGQLRLFRRPRPFVRIKQTIDIGPMSGKSNVIFWLERHNIEPTEEVVTRIYEAAKNSNHTLTDAEIKACL